MVESIFNDNVPVNLIPFGEVIGRVDIFNPIRHATDTVTIEFHSSVNSDARRP